MPNSNLLTISPFLFFDNQFTSFKSDSYPISAFTQPKVDVLIQKSVHLSWRHLPPSLFPICLLTWQTQMHVSESLCVFFLITVEGRIQYVPHGRKKIRIGSLEPCNVNAALDLWCPYRVKVSDEWSVCAHYNQELQASDRL